MAPLVIASCVANNETGLSAAIFFSVCSRCLKGTDQQLLKKDSRCTRAQRLPKESLVQFRAHLMHSAFSNFPDSRSFELPNSHLNLFQYFYTLN